MPMLKLKALCCCAGVALLSSFSSLLAQCVVGTNQPPQYIYMGSYVAFPKFGARGLVSGVWTPMSPSGIRYVYCNLGPTSSNCLSGGSDLLFTAAQITDMDTAFTNWTNARVTNGSNLTFTKVPALTDQTFTIKISRLFTVAMPGILGTVSSWGFTNIDYNNDGGTDEFRLLAAEMEIREDVSGSTLIGVMAHEVGHVMGLNECPGCNATSVMSYAIPGPSGPSACDTSQVRTMFP